VRNSLQNTIAIPKNVPMFVVQNVNPFPACDTAPLRLYYSKERQNHKQMKKTTDNSGTTERTEIFGRLYKSLTTGIKNGNTLIAKEWLNKRKLTIEKTGAGFNSGQIHHRKEQAFKDELESIAFLQKSTAKSKTGEQAYKIFGDYSILFPLKNEANQVANFYAVSLESGKTEFLNEEGIYPKYPNITTTKLYIAPTILETATILEADILSENEAVITVFDLTLKQQHREAIAQLKQLQEIIFITNTERQ